ncbi:hypothetical protein [Mucilaginibacter polytrichastri]|nr:hypothetical protein [Mucilaginibacter polytrichastri]SFT04768.1 hypothetical protein SAMN04487890_10946 [Mucilaginibacter polytrichastri]
MVPFFLELELDNKPLIIAVEQLQNFADVDGYCRYDITAAERRAVVYVNLEYEDLQLPVSPQDLETYYEAIHYPEQAQAFITDDDELFSTKEFNVIAAAIRQYNREAGMSFPEFNFDL